MKKLDLNSIVINEKNISQLKNVHNDSYNIKKLLGVQLTQSQSIKFGTIFQNIVKDIVKAAGGEVLTQQFADVYGTGSKSNKGKKDVDIWFKFRDKIYYFEAKTNLDLDSEKSKATDSKVDLISKWMSQNHPGVEVVSGVLSCWWCKEAGLPVKVKSVLFMEDLFRILEISISSREYYDLMLNLGKSL